MFLVASLALVSQPGLASCCCVRCIAGVDPCAMGHDCQHICVNSNASYYCKCRTGFILNADKKTCSLKQVKVEVVEDPCKCEARLAFQKQTQAALQQLTTKISDVSRRIEVLESLAGRG